MKNKTYRRKPNDKKIADALISTLPTLPNLYVGGETYSPSSLAALLEARIVAADAVSAANVQLNKAKRAHEALDARVRPALRDLHKLALALFGPRNLVLWEFGITPQVLYKEIPS
jgi:hypothetical protein